jgi:hypothetical protein
VFRAAVAGDPVFARAVDADDTRHALDEVAEYDTFRDGFLVLPTLQSMCAFTLFPFTLFFADWLTGRLAVWLRFLGKRTSMASANSSIRKPLLVGQRVYPSSHMDPAYSRWPPQCQVVLSATPQSPSVGIAIYTGIPSLQRHDIPCPRPQLRDNCRWGTTLRITVRDYMCHAYVPFPHPLSLFIAKFRLSGVVRQVRHILQRRGSEQRVGFALLI